MSKLYLLTAAKTIAGQKLHCAINVLGLAVGLACCLMIGLFVRYEMSYDSFFRDAGNIYRLSSDLPAIAGRPERHLAGSPGPLVPWMLENRLDNVREAARLVPLRTMVVGETLVAQERVYYADPAFFRIFDFEWLRGSPESAFVNPDSIVITASVAARFFGDSNPYGQILSLDDRSPMTVRGIIADIPGNSHLEDGLFVPMEMLNKIVPFIPLESWSAALFSSYVLLEENANTGSLMDSVSRAVTAAFTASNTPGAPVMTAHALEDIHLAPPREGEVKPAGNPVTVAAYAAIAGALLLIACINYMNLATARTAWRAREVGIRKTSGAGRRELFGQFLGESFLTVILALCLAIALVEVLLPVFSNIVARPLAFADLAEPMFLLFIAAVVLLTALIAGTYPAFWLSGFHPAKVLRAQGGTVHGGGRLRSVLVVLQFTMAITLVTATLVVQLQMKFVQDSDLGFTRENMLIVRGSNEKGLGQQWPALKRELLTHPDILSVAEGSMVPSIGALRRVRMEGETGNGIEVSGIQGGFDFLQTYGVPLIAGRYFDERVASDASTVPGFTAESVLRGSYVLSESAVRALGLTPDEAIDRRMEVDFSRDGTGIVAGRVIGVVADVHATSLREFTSPKVFYVPDNVLSSATAASPVLAAFNQASVRLAGGNASDTVAWIRERWKLFLDAPLMVEFLDTRYDALYQEEEHQAGLITFFSALTTGIACLGLFGLASFTVEKRFREIGIRKVLGGRVWQIVMLLTNEFSKLVLIANVIAWPLAYLAAVRWLEHFAYRIDLTPLIFIGSGAIALCIAWVTVAGTAAKAASARPVLALRYE